MQMRLGLLWITRFSLRLGYSFKDLQVIASTLILISSFVETKTDLAKADQHYLRFLSSEKL